MVIIVERQIRVRMCVFRRDAQKTLCACYLCSCCGVQKLRVRLLRSMFFVFFLLTRDLYANIHYRHHPQMSTRKPDKESEDNCDWVACMNRSSIDDACANPE